MNSKVLYALSGVTVALILGTVWLTPAPISEHAAPGERMFPGLTADAVNGATNLAVTAKGKTITVYKKDGTWVVKEMADYPADPSLVRKALFSLLEIRPYEAKTRDPKRLAKLELEDPKGKDAQSKQLTVKDKDGKVLADIVVGKSNTTNVILGKEMVYVRKAGDNQAWLAEGDPSLKDAVLDWVKRDVIDIDVERVAEVETKNPKGEEVLHLAKTKPDDKEYTVKNLPEGRKPKEARTIGYVAEALDNVQLDDVKKAADIDFAKNGVGTGTWRTFDGLLIKVRMAEQDKKFWVTLTAEVDEEALLKEKPKAGSKLKDAETVRKEAAEINTRVRGWAYHLPTTSSRFMQYKIDDVSDAPKKEEPKKEEPKKEEPKKSEPAKPEPKKSEEKKEPPKATPATKVDEKKEEKKAEPPAKAEPPKKTDSRPPGGKR
ncbi:MAG: DUF4340 domain-containing protein [Rhodospirillaceae bacterium]|nr:DUF4340 domain-containing protein [Rhodospirillaceae bacterium]